MKATKLTTAPMVFEKPLDGKVSAKSSENVEDTLSPDRGHP